jgi:hypothetical protein
MNNGNTIFRLLNCALLFFCFVGCANFPSSRKSVLYIEDEKNKSGMFAEDRYARIRFTRDSRPFSREFKGGIFLMATNLEDHPDNIVTIGTNRMYPSKMNSGIVEVLDFYPGHDSQLPFFEEGYQGDRCSLSYDELLKYLNGKIEKVMTYDEYCKDNGIGSLTSELIFRKTVNKSRFKYVRLKRVSIIGEMGIHDELSWYVKPGVTRLIVVFPFTDQTVFHLTDPIYFQSDRDYFFDITSSGVRFVKCLARTPSTGK